VRTTDTYLLLLDRTSCRRPPVGDLSRSSPRFECDPIDGLTSLRVDVDGNNPLSGSRWSATKIKQRSVQRCAATAVVNGREVCTRYEYIPEDYSAALSGHLIIIGGAARP
jgi:hypothetical protein